MINLEGIYREELKENIAQLHDKESYCFVFISEESELNTNV